MLERVHAGGLVLSAALAFLGCQAMRPQLGPTAAPGEAYQNSVADDGTVARSMSEGGQSDQPFVVDGTVRSVTEHTVLIETDDLGSRQLFVNSRTEITLDGRPASLADLRPGTRIRAAYSPTRVAWGLQAGKGATRDHARAD